MIDTLHPFGTQGTKPVRVRMAPFPNPPAQLAEGAAPTEFLLPQHVTAAPAAVAAQPAAPAAQLPASMAAPSGGFKCLLLSHRMPSCLDTAFDSHAWQSGQLSDRICVMVATALHWLTCHHNSQRTSPYCDIVATGVPATNGAPANGAVAPLPGVFSAAFDWSAWVPGPEAGADASPASLPPLPPPSPGLLASMHRDSGTAAAGAAQLPPGLAGLTGGLLPQPSGAGLVPQSLPLGGAAQHVGSFRSLLEDSPMLGDGAAPAGGALVGDAADAAAGDPMDVDAAPVHSAAEHQAAAPQPQSQQPASAQAVMAQLPLQAEQAGVSAPAVADAGGRAASPAAAPSAAGVATAPATAEQSVAADAEAAGVADAHASTASPATADHTYGGSPAEGLSPLDTGQADGAEGADDQPQTVDEAIEALNVTWAPEDAPAPIAGGAGLAAQDGAAVEFHAAPQAADELAEPEAPVNVDSFMQGFDSQ